MSVLGIIAVVIVLAWCVLALAAMAAGIVALTIALLSEIADDREAARDAQDAAVWADLVEAYQEG